MPVPGPAVLGRGVVVLAGDSVPEPWAVAPRTVIDDEVLVDPASVVSELHHRWMCREPHAVVLHVDAGVFREPRSFAGEPYTYTPAFEPWWDRLHFLVWANTYDGRGGREPTWWWGVKAARLGATVADDRSASGDICLADGTWAWVDGGPRQELPLDTVIHSETVEHGALVVATHPTGDDGATPQLAPDQLEAVHHDRGPARVIAPAGSGKTRVLTAHLRHLLRGRSYERGSVLAVAYNREAEQELKARLIDLQPRVRTLNSLGYQLVSDHDHGRPELVEERGVRSILDKIVAISRRRANVDPFQPYLDALSEIRLGLRAPDEVEASRDDVPGLAEAFPRYRAALAEIGAVDFDEQIYGAIERLLANGPFRRVSQLGCRHLLVDEFQDLTPAHVLMLRLLAAPAYDVFGVGDDDQVIYGHAGADPGFLIDFGQYFPDASEHALEVNYRCPVPVVDGAATLLGYNRRRVAKTIRASDRPAEPEAGSEALLVVEHPPDAAAAEVVRLVEAWRDDAVGLDDIAVLSRVTSLLLAPHAALRRAGFDLRSIVGPSVLRRTGVRAALAYLRIAADPDSIAGADLIEVFRRPSRGLPRWFPDRLGRRQRWDLRSLRAMRRSLSDRDADKVDMLVSDLELVVAAARGGSTLQVLNVVRDDVGLGGAMSLLDGKATPSGSTHLDDLDALTQVARLEPDPAAFEPWLRDTLAEVLVDDSTGAVRLSTIHRVKGREWDRVIVFGANDGVMPHRLADDVEEERRVFHVAITRAVERAVVLADIERPSPFVAELRGTAPRPAEASRVVRSSSAPSVTPRPKESDDRDLDAVEQERFERLREWRKQRASDEGVPAYVVASNKTLRAVAIARPTDLGALLRCPGIGPTKIELYGDDILEVLDEAVR